MKKILLLVMIFSMVQGLSASSLWTNEDEYKAKALSAIVGTSVILGAKTIADYPASKGGDKIYEIYPIALMMGGLTYMFCHSELKYMIIEDRRNANNTIVPSIEIMDIK